MEKKDQPKKTRDKSKKHQAILNAAVQAYREEGYYGASMDRITEIAGVSKATVYNHFPGKELLFEAVISDYLLEQMQYKQIPYDPSRPLGVQLEAFADAEIWLVNSPERAGLAKVLTAVFLRQPELAMKARALCSPPREPLRIWMEAAHKEGRLSAEDPEFAAQFFYSMVEGTITWPALFAGFPAPDELSRMKQEIITTFLCRFEGRR